MIVTTIRVPLLEVEVPATTDGGALARLLILVLFSHTHPSSHLIVILMFGFAIQEMWTTLSDTRTIVRRDALTLGLAINIATACARI